MRDLDLRPVGLQCKVLILDAHSSAAVAVLQSLGRAGYHTSIAGFSEQSLAWRSRYAREKFVYPDPLTDKQSFKDWLLALQRIKGFDFILPTTDSSIYPLMELRRELELGAELVLPSDDSFDWVFNKERTRLLADRCGVPNPVTRLVSDDGWQADKWSMFPYFVKPVQSKAWCEQQGTHLEARLVDCRAELGEAIEFFLPFGDVQVQEYVQGQGVGVEVLCDQGRIVWAFAHRRVHEYPLTGGGSTYRVSIDVPPTLLEASQKMLGEIKWHGVAMVEFKVRDDQFWLMEINGRFWGSLPLAIYAGADFPAALMALSTGQPISLLPSYRVGVYARNLVSDIRWMKANIKADKSDRTLLTQPVALSVLEWGRLFLFKECWDHVSWHDHRVAIALFKRMLMG